MRRRIGRPSPALVISCIALVMSMTAGAYAVVKAPKNSVTSKSIKKGAVKLADLGANAVDSSKVKDDSLGGGDVNEGGLAKVPSAAFADSAGTASSAASATTADSVYAFGHYTAGGNLQQALSKNLSGVTVEDAQAGVYCFDLPFVPLGAQATAENDGGPDEIAQVTLAQSSTGGLVNCATGTEVELTIYDPSAAALEDGPFYVQFYR